MASAQGPFPLSVPSLPHPARHPAQRAVPRPSRRRLPLALRALEVPNYRRWAAADFISNAGSWMSTAALGWLVFDVTGSAAAMGGIVAVKQAPGVLLGLLGGALADRWEARRILPVTQGLYAAVAVLLAVLAHTGDARVWQLYVCAAVTGVLGALDGPCFGRLVAQVLGTERLGNGIALGSLTHSLGWVTGLGLGSMVLAGPGAWAVFALDAISYAAVVAMVLSLEVDELHSLPRAAAGRGRIRDGLDHVLRSRPLTAVLGVGLVTGALGKHFQVTMLAMTEQAFAGDAALYGRLFTCFSLGAVLGALVAARMPRLGARLVFVVGGATAVVQATAGLAPSVWLFALAMVAAATAGVVYDTSTSTVVQLLAPGDLRGRVIAVQTLVGAVAGMVGAPLLGWLADNLGAREALVLGGTVSMVAVGLGALVLARGPRRLVTLAVTRPQVALAA